MANEKISTLPVAGTLDGSELLPVVKAGVNKKTTAQEIADLGLQSLNDTILVNATFENEMNYLQQLADNGTETNAISILDDTAVAKINIGVDAAGKTFLDLKDVSPLSPSVLATDSSGRVVMADTLPNTAAFNVNSKFNMFFSGQWNTVTLLGLRSAFKSVYDTYYQAKFTDYTESFVYTGSSFTLTIAPTFIYSIRTTSTILDENDVNDVTISGTTLTVINSSFSAGEKLYIKYKA